MTNFVHWLLATEEAVWSRVVEKGWFGQRYIRAGPVVVTLGGWYFEQGGALGYGLEGHAGILGKLLGCEAGREQEGVQSLRATAESRLKEVEGRERNFFELWAKPSMRDGGINVTQWPPSKALDQHMSVPQAARIMALAFAIGATISFHFPDAFKGYWEETYRSRPDDEWQKFRAMGIALSENQGQNPLNAEVTRMAELAALWAEQVSPNAMVRSEISVLRDLAERKA